MTMARKPGVFITATDTGVGKTLVAAGLAMAMRARGLKVGVMKPVATGCYGIEKRLISQDAVFLLEAAENEWTGLTCPSRFRNPLAPTVAGLFERKEVNLNQLRWAYRELQKNYDFIIVEGIGGLMVPLTKDYYVANLIKEFELPVLIVSRASLGTINHTVLTVDACLIRGFQILGLIFNRLPKANFSTAEITNPKAIHDLTQIPVLGSIPEMDDVNVESCQFGKLKEVFSERVNMEKILSSFPSLPIPQA